MSEHERPTEEPLDPEQVDGLLDMDPERFRAAAHVVVDRIADYLATVERYPVLPPVEPGSIGRELPDRAPEDFRANATLRMKIANMLIDETIRRIKVEESLGLSR